VNRFRRGELVSLIESTVGVRLVQWQKLYSSFAYLSRLAELLKAPPPDLPKRLLAFQGWRKRTLPLMQSLLYRGTRIADRMFGTNLAVYGWALYFERAAKSVTEQPAYVNVCMYCGAGHAAASVERSSRLTYVCAGCHSVNPYVEPFGNTI
jgi:hypothetical protein